MTDLTNGEHDNALSPDARRTSGNLKAENFSAKLRAGLNDPNSWIGAFLRGTAIAVGITSGHQAMNAGAVPPHRAPAPLPHFAPKAPEQRAPAPELRTQPLSSRPVISSGSDPAHLPAEPDGAGLRENLMIEIPRGCWPDK